MDKENIPIVTNTSTETDASTETDTSTANELLSPASPEYIESTPESQIDDESIFQYCIRGRKDRDFIWTTPYRQDIYEHLKEIQSYYYIYPYYMRTQPSMNWKVRRTAVDWLVGVVERYNLQPETLYLAVQLIDRYLERVTVLRDDIQLVATASIFLASKYEEICPPELKDFIYMTDHAYTRKKVLNLARFILKILKFDLSIPTTYTFLKIYLSMCNPPERSIRVLNNFSKYLCEMSLLDGDIFLKYLPGILAAGSVALANYIIGLPMWDKDLEDKSGYRLTDLYHVCEFLLNKLHQMSTYPQQAVYQKYTSVKYTCVSLLQYPNRLVIPSFLAKGCSCVYCNPIR